MKKHKNLVLIAVGDNLNYQNCLGIDANFDLMTVYYGESRSWFDEHQSISNYCFSFKHVSAKFQCLHNNLIRNIVLEYDYIYLLDDDIEITSDQINELFRIAEKEDLQICQPATYNTGCPHLFEPQGSYIRYTNFVEMMQPLFKREALDKCIESVLLTNSSWGADVSWWKILGENPKSLAVVDCIVSRHMGELGADHGRFEDVFADLHTTFSRYNTWSEWPWGKTL